MGLLISPIQHLFGQQLEFARTQNETGTEASVKVIYDHSNQFIVTGYTQIIPGGVGGTNGASNTWVKKYDANGMILWSVQTNYTGTVNQEGAEVSSVSVDSENNIYIAGTFISESVTLGGVTYSVPANGKLNLFYAKINASGIVQWVKGVEESHFSLNPVMASTISVTPDDQLILTGGYFKGVIIGNDTLAGDPLSSLVGMTPFGFYAKLDTNGTPIWAKSFSNLVTNAYNSFSGIASTAIDDEGNLFFMMGLDSAVVMGNDTISSPYLTAVVKTDPAGEFIRAVIPKASYDITRQIALDKCGNILLLGEFLNAIQIESTILIAGSASSRAVFVAKLDNDLDLVWMKQFHSTGADLSSGIACNDRNDVFFAFEFWGEINYDEPFTPSPLGMMDALLIKLDEDGNFVWHKHSMGSGNTSTSSVSVSPANHILMAGRYLGQENFDGTIINSTPVNLSDVWFAAFEDTTLALLPADCQEDLGLNSFTKQTNMLIYPNPAQDNVSIAFHGTVHQTQLTITDISGRIMHAIVLENKTPLISTAAFPEGMYLVRVQQADGIISTGKFIVKR